MFFNEEGDVQAITVTSQLYTEIVNEFLATKLPPNHNLWLQQDAAMPHTVMISMAVLCHLFLQQVLSHSVMCYCPSFTGPNST